MNTQQLLDEQGGLSFVNQRSIGAGKEKIHANAVMLSESTYDAYKALFGDMYRTDTVENLIPVFGPVLNGQAVFLYNWPS